MIKNDLKISNLENYTFSKYSTETNGIDKINSLLKYEISLPKRGFSKEKYSNKKINNKQSSYLYSNNNKDINYNQLNIMHREKSPIKKNYNNINNINNINIISQNEYNHNTNYNNININRFKKNTFSKERKSDKKKFRTPDKHLNYNKFNYINSNDIDSQIHFRFIKFKNKSISNNINYNENLINKFDKKSKKKSLTPDITNCRSNHCNKNLLVFPSDYNKNNNNINIINPNSDLYNLNSKNSFHLFNDNSSNNGANSENNYKLYNFNSSMKNKNEYNFSYGLNKYNNNTEKKKYSNNLNLLDNKRDDNSNYQESCFNSRLQRGAKVPLISKVNKNLIQSDIYSNKTSGHIRKSKSYLKNSIYNSKKESRYKRSVSSEPDFKKMNNKLKQKYFKLKIFNKDYSQNNSFSNKSKDIYSVNSYINKKYNKIFNNINTSCAYSSSSFYNNDKRTNHTNENNYNMTQPDFSNSLYNWNLGKHYSNKLLNKEENNSVKNLNNNKDLYYKYLKYDSQNYNYLSYMDSCNSTNKENTSISNKTLKTKKYNFEKYLNINNNTTKLSTNNNTYDENSNNTNSLYNKEIKNNIKNIGSSTIEEVHFNFVNILQNTKNMMEKQENNNKDKVICNDLNSTTIILEEKDID